MHDHGKVTVIFAGEASGSLRFLLARHGRALTEKVPKADNLSSIIFIACSLHRGGGMKYNQICIGHMEIQYVLPEG